MKGNNGRVELVVDFDTFSIHDLEISLLSSWSTAPLFRV